MPAHRRRRRGILFNSRVSSFFSITALAKLCLVTSSTSKTSLNNIVLAPGLQSLTLTSSVDDLEGAISHRVSNIARMKTRSPTTAELSKSAHTTPFVSVAAVPPSVLFPSMPSDSLSSVRPVALHKPLATLLVPPAAKALVPFMPFRQSPTSVLKRNITLLDIPAKSLEIRWDHQKTVPLLRGTKDDIRMRTLATSTRTPAKAVKLGGAVLVTLAQVIKSSLLELHRGNFSGCWQAAQEAIFQEHELNFTTEIGLASGASKVICILMWCLMIFGLWGLEMLLSKTTDQRLGEPSDQLTKIENARFFRALNFPGYLMSWHVVLHNYYHEGEENQASSSGDPFVIFSDWGSLAVPWFFLVSGFVNTYSKRTGPKPNNQEDWFYAMFKKVVAWYPLVVLSLTWCAIRLWSIEAEAWSHYMSSLLLVNGLIWEGNYFPFLLDDWCLCFLMVYLLAWSPMHHVLTNSSNSAIWTLFTIAFIVVIPSAILEWIWFADFPLYRLIQYWPAFVFGQALATWFVRKCMQEEFKSVEVMYVRRPLEDIPLVVRFGATISFVSFGIMFFLFSPYTTIPLIGKEVAPFLLKGGLLPLQGLMVASLAYEADPIAKFFARMPFCWTRKITFANFILHVPIHNTLKDWTGWSGMTWTGSLILLVASILGHGLIERPWRRFLRRCEK